jgi:hypothetical protein
MKWEETATDKVWLLDNKWKIAKAKRFRHAAFVPESIRALGSDIYHCYDHAGKYAHQTTDLSEAKKFIEKLAKTYASSKN